MRRYLDHKLKMRQLRVIAAIATQGSLLRASEVLGVSQPALTKSLREIEDLLEVRLFERHARGVEPSAHGAVMAETAERILAIAQQAEQRMERIDRQSDGTVVIGALPTAAAGVMPAVVRRLRAEHPGITVRVVEDRLDILMGALSLGDIDLIVGRLYPPLRPEENIVRVTLYDEPMAVIVGAQHPLAALPCVTAADLARYELSIPIASLRIHEDTMAFLGGIAPQLWISEDISTTSLPLLRELLLSSPLATVMPLLMLAGDLMRGTLRALPLTGERQVPRPAGLIHRADRPLMPPARIVSALVADHARQMLGQAGS